MIFFFLGAVPLKRDAPMECETASDIHAALSTWTFPAKTAILKNSVRSSDESCSEIAASFLAVRSGTNGFQMSIYKLYAQNSNAAGFWVQHRTWRNVWPRIQSIAGQRTGVLPGSHPLYDNAEVIIQRFDVPQWPADRSQLDDGAAARPKLHKNCRARMVASRIRCEIGSAH